MTTATTNDYFSSMFKKSNDTEIEVLENEQFDFGGEFDMCAICQFMEMFLSAFLNYIISSPEPKAQR